LFIWDIIQTFLRLIELYFYPYPKTFKQCLFYWKLNESLQTKNYFLLFLNWYLLIKFMSSVNHWHLKGMAILCLVYSKPFTFKTTQHNYNCHRKTLYRYGQLNTNERNVAYNWYVTEILKRFIFTGYNKHLVGDLFILWSNTRYNGCSWRALYVLCFLTSVYKVI
jgi:hypothetical protein